METSIVDVPRKYSEADLFGIKVYQDALIDFISYTKCVMNLYCFKPTRKENIINRIFYTLEANFGI